MDYTLLKPLPGREAQALMAPPYRLATLFDPPPAGAVDAAVLIVLAAGGRVRTASGPDWSVLLIRRNSYPGAHSGQIAFPGGKQEPADRDFLETACRETLEEVGLRRRDLGVAGSLTPIYVPPSNFLIHPFLAVLARQAPLRLDPREVVDCKYVPVSACDPSRSVSLDFAYDDGTTRPAPAWVFENYTIWGATAMILAEVFVILRENRLRAQGPAA